MKISILFNIKILYFRLLKVNCKRKNNTSKHKLNNDNFHIKILNYANQSKNNEQSHLQNPTDKQNIENQQVNQQKPNNLKIIHLISILLIINQFLIVL